MQKNLSGVDFGRGGKPILGVTCSDPAFLFSLVLSCTVGDIRVELDVVTLSEIAVALSGVTVS